MRITTQEVDILSTMFPVVVEEFMREVTNGVVVVSQMDDGYEVKYEDGTVSQVVGQLLEAMSRAAILGIAKHDDFLKVSQKAKEVGLIEVERVSRDRRTWYFKVGSSKADQTYIVVIKLVRPEDPEEIASLTCSCPAYKYWGFKYINSMRDLQWGTRLYRPPNVRNPMLLGGICKHIYAVLDRLPELIKDAVSKLEGV